MVYLFDGTYDGLLSAVFETYRAKQPDSQLISAHDWQETLFDTPEQVATNPEHARRVRDGLIKKGYKKAPRHLYRCFLSEKPEIPGLVLSFIEKAMASPRNISDNYADPTVLALKQIDKMMGREVHRMHAFVRFQELKDGTFVSVIEPDFDVLPLITSHFRKRYPAQKWLIYDAQRHYGKLWNEKALETVTFSEEDHNNFRKMSPSILEEAETDYQNAWKRYFKSTNIPARRNMKLHLQHVPRRYWKYLVEKQ